jgi:HK97 gp10 family phage protein
VTDIRVEGLAELEQMLKRTLPDRLQGKALQGALAKAARPIVTTARQLAPVKTGRLRSAIYSKRSRFSKPGFERRIIAVRRGKKQQKNDRDAFYWKWIEFGRGVVRRTRKGDEGKSLGTPDAGWFGAEVKAIPARPFMRPAFESNKTQAIEIIRRELAGEIKKVAARQQARVLARLRKTVTGF